MKEFNLEGINIHNETSSGGCMSIVRQKTSSESTKR
jgi:hypothetical protein